MVNPPKEGRESDEVVRQHRGEEQILLDTLKIKAKMITEGLNSMEKITC
jgi:hypothetical protein